MFSIDDDMQNYKNQMPSKKESVKIKLLTAIFDFELEQRKIPAFRAAVSEKAGRENILFHNHLDNRFLYSYPLIQYKIINKNPAIICIGQGSEEILKFFAKPDWDIFIHGRKIQCQIKHIGFDYFVCGLFSDLFHYRIYNWFAFNEKNYQKYQLLFEDSDKIKFLCRIMTGNILSFAKGIGWNIDGHLNISIPTLPRHHLLTLKKHQMTGFNLDFSTNVNLPDYIGLGKSVSRGFGIIRKRR